MAVVAGRRRGLVGLLSAEGISRMGTAMSALAIPWFVLVTTGSATLTGLAAFAEMLPYVIVAGLAGPVVDRIGARRVAIWSNVVAAGLVAAVPLLHAAGLLHLSTLLFLVAVIGVARGAASVTYVLVPGVAEIAGSPIERVTGLHDGINRVAQMLGAPVAGVLLALYSADVVLVVDAASFAIAGLIMATMVPRAADPKHNAELATADEIDHGEGLAGYLSSLREGLRFLRGDRTLVAIAVMVLVTNLLDMAYGSVLVPVWVRDELGSPLGLGLIAGLFGVGAVAGSALYAWLGPRLPRRRTFAWSFLLVGAPRFAALALASTLPPVLIVVLVAGLACGSINPILGAVEFERVPRRLQARVLGALGAIAWAGIPVGGLLGGLLVGGLGVTGALWVCGAGYAVATVAPFTLPAFRGFDRGAGTRPAAAVAAHG
ncbi:MAG TPA: MFS transporter, partial [Candidatus Nanopelagicales bacterium]|nr:MFS transporter [Candidatus Nanopelagicales bacterium]